MDEMARENLRKFMIDSFDFTDYDSFSDERNPFIRGFKTFIDEKEWELKRNPNTYEVFKDYFWGLPTWISMPFNDFDIANLLYALGYDQIKDEDWDDDKISELYVDEVYSIFMEEIEKVKRAMAWNS